MSVFKTTIRFFRILFSRWLFFVNALTIIGATSAFGLIASVFLNLSADNAILMIAVVPPMTIVVIISDFVVVRAIHKRMSRLIDGIQVVANGNMDVSLDTKGAEEYAEIYRDFNLMVRELKATKEEMNNFVNELSHEFKTPITSLQGFAQYLYETGEAIETPERMKYLRVIADESQRLAQLSTNMLLLSKVEACQIITDREPFNLGEQIRRCVILLLRQIEKKRIEVGMELPEEIAFYGNPELLEQVWINLLGNAVKFTPENGEISISAQIEDTVVRISISDSGIGMDRETRAHIFEKYYQHDAGHTAQGNGIGLSIAHCIVTLCQGKIKVASTPGRGSTFTVVLPVGRA